MDDDRMKNEQHGKEATQEKGNHEKGDPHMGGFNLNKNTLLLMAGGALGALALVGMGKAANRMRPATVGAVKEGYAFKEWLAGKFDKFKEDLEDVVAEGVYEHQSDAAAKSDMIKREKELLEKIEKLVEEKLAKMQTEKKEG